MYNRTQTKKADRADMIHLARYRRSKRPRYPRKDVKVGDIIESCNLHLGIVYKVNPLNGDCDYVSLMTGDKGSCDLYHCGVYVVPTKEVIMKLDVWNREGKEGLRKLWDRKLLLA